MIIYKMARHFSWECVSMREEEEGERMLISNCMNVSCIVRRCPLQLVCILRLTISQAGWSGSWRCAGADQTSGNPSCSQCSPMDWTGWQGHTRFISRFIKSTQNTILVKVWLNVRLVVFHYVHLTNSSQSGGTKWKMLSLLSKVSRVNY